MIKTLRENKFWFSTFGTLAASAGLALSLKTDHFWFGFGWVLLCISVIAIAVYPGRYDVAALEATLEAFYKAMQFPPDEDIRCAIYVPIKKGMFLKQITNYMPKGERGSGHKVHSSKGIIGAAYRENEHRVEILKDPNYSSSEFFQSRMVTRWGFTKDEARNLTQDRRAYCALVIKDEKEAILGVLYCDSNKLPAFLDPDTFERAKKFAPFFSELLKLKGGR